MLPGDVGVAGGSSARRGPAQSQDVRSERGQPLGTELGVYEIQMCSHDNHGGVGGSRLEATTHILRLYEISMFVFFGFALK